MPLASNWFGCNQCCYLGTVCICAVRLHAQVNVCMWTRHDLWQADCMHCMSGSLKVGVGEVGRDWCVCLQVVTEDMHGYMIASNSTSVEQIQNAKQRQFDFWRQLHHQQQQSYHSLSRHSPHLHNAAAGGMQAGGTQQMHDTTTQHGFEGQPRSQDGGSSRFCSGEQQKQHECCHSTAHQRAATGSTYSTTQTASCSNPFCRQY